MYIGQLSEWFVYMLRCADNSLYTGVTTDIERRLKEHNEDKAGAKYTRAKRPVFSAHPGPQSPARPDFGHRRRGDGFLGILELHKGR